MATSQKTVARSSEPSAGSKLARSILLELQKASNLLEFVYNRHRLAELTCLDSDLSPAWLYFFNHSSCLLFQFILFPFPCTEITLQPLLLYLNSWADRILLPPTATCPPTPPSPLPCPKWQGTEWRPGKDDITLSDSLYVDTEPVLSSLVHASVIFRKPPISVILESVWCYHYVIKQYFSSFWIVLL